MPSRPNTTKKEVGKDAQLCVGGSEFEITSVSYTEEANNANVQFNTSLTQDIVTTGVEYSGSFEHAGNNAALRNALWETEAETGSAIPRWVDMIRVADAHNTYRFKGCLVESRDKDMPADDRTSVTYDFVAEQLSVE